MQWPLLTCAWNNRKERKGHREKINSLRSLRSLRLDKKVVASRAEGSTMQLDQMNADADSLIDQIVYRFYGLTPDEIKIVEDAAK